MAPSFSGVALLLGAFVADQLGPFWWRLYWVAVAILLIRLAAVVWRRLQLSRMAAGLVVVACTFAAFRVLGTGQREVSQVIGSHLVWFAAPLSAVFLLFYWEIRHSPERLNVLRTSLRAASLRDRFTLRHIPDLHGQQDA